jgi:hypothetical protein
MGEHRRSAGSLREVAARLAEALHRAGYDDVRLVPVGLAYAHGFAIATRLEKIAPAGVSDSDEERWSPLYPSASELRWLALASTPRMPSRGRFRILLVCVSDLPLVSSNRPFIESEWTVMDGPDVPQDAPLPTRSLGSGYRLSLQVYEFEADGGGRSVMLDGARASEAASAVAARLALDL